MSVTLTQKIEDSLGREEWERARKLIERELAVQPKDHWLLTQLGVTHYERGRYEESLTPLLASLEIVSDCPLTLWNLAGSLDALGKPDIAVGIYTWLLKSKKTSADDACWESETWTDSLKTDCVFRVGVCFQRMKREETATHCFRQYINLVLAGMSGTYSLDNAAEHIREMHEREPRQSEKEVREAFASTLQDSGVQSIQGKRRKLPKLLLAELLAT